ncbi:CDP-glucose 4,6-dehydratase [Candidatus Clostridium radicumherbarum]|uniref:CDP-glucose 4,6-dehydratase n=1 Tax=Candidatus Clostridium radicumherbarum TaxID=3381662 RepID=A0ABW8TLQ6_9CLOT
MAELINAYNGKTVLITGHTGFKGSWLALWLNKIGAKIIGYALDPVNDKDNYTLSKLKEKIIDVRGDIRDTEKLNAQFKSYKPEIVFHLAAQPLVRYSYEHPKYTYEVNVIGTLNILEAIRNTENTKVGIIITSDKCYDNKEWIWGYRENDPLGGYDPYSSSKGCVEILVSSYRNSFFNVDQYPLHHKAIATVRAGNVIGGGDWSTDRIVPDCIRALEADKTIVIRNPNSIRPWQHVLEPLSGYLALGEKLLNQEHIFSGAWNFGPNQESIINVEEFTKKIIKYWGSGNWISNFIYNKNLHESSFLSLDINKAKFFLNWYPKWNIDKAIEMTVQWYKSYNKQDIYELCSEQINEYCKS